MTTATSDIQLIGDVSQETREALRANLLHCYSTFAIYEERLQTQGISRDDILRRDPLVLLRRLPLLEGEVFDQLIDESVMVGEEIIDVEMSSGSTGRRKRRFISYDDDVADLNFVAELFRVCGVGRSDRVACLDTDPVNLFIAFTKAFDLLVVEEAYTYCVGLDFDGALEGLPKLDPSVIVTVPSILERCFESLMKHYASIAAPRLSKIIFVGERSSTYLRSALRSAFGVEMFDFYGASETSALGIECSAHDGIHLFNDRNVFEMVADGPSSLTGQIVVTTLVQKTLPLLRYALRDAITLKPGDCPCGLEHPRVEVKGRVGDGFSILGTKMYYDAILRSVYYGAESPGFMQLVLTREEEDRLTIFVPKSLQHRESQVREALLSDQQDLGFLVTSGFLNLELTFVDEDYFGASRKLKRVVDRRGSRNEAASRI